MAEPERPAAAFFLYMQERKANHDGAVDSAFARTLQERWNSFTRRQKEPYDILAQRLNTIYIEQAADHKRHGRYEVRAVMEIE